MSGTLSSRQASARCSAMDVACASLSITHGPAIRNSGASPPSATFLTENVVISVISSNRLDCVRKAYARLTWIATEGGRKSSVGSFRCSHPRFHRTRVMVPAVFVARTDERSEKRMRRERLRFEFRMKLNADEPGMIVQFDDLDVNAVWSLTSYLKSCGDQSGLIVAIEFVAVPMALGNFKLT